jgi:23S rRNA (guanosine2251-2'-O)-methyltransferase
MSMKEFIYGRNPVLETLRAGRRNIFQLLLAEGVQEKGRLVDVLNLAAKKKVPIERVARTRLDRINQDNQGCVLEASGYPYVILEDILEYAVGRAEPLEVLLLDSLQDPQNLGTLMRTAEAAGMHGVIIPEHRSAEITPSVVSSSAGASEYLLIARENLVEAIKKLKDAGAWIIGLDESPESQDISKIPLDGPLGIVVGSEGSGIRPLVRSSCDFLLRLPMLGRVESLNAAVAGSIVLYNALLARQKNKSTG